MTQTAPVNEVLQALRGGPATLDALAARLGGAGRDALLWALQDAREQGLVACTDDIDCGPDGLCGTSVPLVCRLTDAGRTATRASG